MKTLQEQYTKKEGKGSKDTFMKSARTQFPNIFNNLSNFDTATKVMKQKQIISEGGIGGVVTTPQLAGRGTDIKLSEEVKAEEKKLQKSRR